MSAPKIEETSFGLLPDGTEGRLFTIESNEVMLTLTTFGARVVSLLTRDRRGLLADICLGYNDAASYATKSNAFFGATIGRFSNRIARGEFRLGAGHYRIPVNNGANALHGGPLGFDLRNWTAKILGDGVVFSLISEDTDQGFPGQLDVRTTYTVQGSVIRLRYEAQTSKPTVVNLTNHTYFNLGGQESPTILNDELTIFADHITEIDESLIPTGGLMPVAGTPFDFTSATVIGKRISSPHLQLLRAKGYDHNFVLRGPKGQLKPAAIVHNAQTGRVLEVATTEPGVQFYSGNFLDGSLVGKGGCAYERQCSLCLETQHFPDSPNHPNFPSTVLLPGDTYRSETEWRFGHD